MADAQPRWMLAPPGGPNGPSWSIIELPSKRPVAIGLALESEARLFLAARELKSALLAQVRDTNTIEGLISLAVEDEPCFCPDHWIGSDHAAWCLQATAAIEKAEGRA